MALLALCLLFIFGYHCPFQSMTGIPCPGCNFTTACIYLLQGKIVTSFWYHALVIPTLICALISIFLWKKNERKKLKYLWLFWGIAMLAYYIVRMLLIFPNLPMAIDEQALLVKLLHNFH
ncbi:hypothetical protein C815_00689 [Firmicutes bacterium M10-2]|nr:hypothetical protein C815_00689 [Firmicutes bacterium M10-2]